MTRDKREWMSEWAAGVRVWMERRGHAILGPGRLALLEAIQQHHSISAAARSLSMSYRRAWNLVDSINRAAGEILVVPQIGGHHGGGAILTECGREAIRLYRELRAKVQQAAVLSLASAQITEPAIVHVAAAASLENVLHCLTADFALQHPTIAVRTICGASDELAGQMVNGFHVDLFLSAEDRQLERLTAAGLIAPDRATILASNCLAAIAFTSRFARLRGPRGLLQSAVKRIALAALSCPLGNYTRSYLEALGLWQSVGRRALFLDNPHVVLAAVESGYADVGLVYRSDALASPGCRLLFFTRPAQPAIHYSAALTHQGDRSPDAGRFLAFLTSSAARRQFRRFGFLAPSSD
jgi:molybdenum ABC transporter molybdate-binding protein